MSEINEDISGLSEKEITREHQEQRLSLWRQIVDRLSHNEELKRVLSAAANATIVSSVKLGAEAWKGKTIEGQKLTPLGRIMDAVIVGTDIGGKIAALSGEWKGGGISYSASWLMWGAMYGPDMLTPIISRARENLESNNHQMARPMKVIENFVTNWKDAFFVKEKNG